MSLKRLYFAFVLTSLIFSCSKKDAAKNTDNVAQPVPTDLCSGVTQATATTLTYYKKSRAAWGEACASLALQVIGSCENGSLQIKGEGFPACEETVLTKLTIKAESTTLEVDGAPLLLTLEGVDQAQQSFVIDNSQASWTSSSEMLLVSADGHVMAKAVADGVTIQASVNGVVAVLIVSARAPAPSETLKNCAETLHGETKTFPRFKQSIVNFLSTCESYEAIARCEDGAFVFKPEDQLSECRKAKLSEFKVDPLALTLKNGESRAVEAEATDETGFRSVLNFSDVLWTVEGAEADQGKVIVADGQILLNGDLVSDAIVKAQYQELTQSITLTKVKVEVSRITFEKDQYLLKNGDSLELKVQGFAADRPADVDKSALIISSSDQSKVIIENNSAKVLSSGGSVVLTAKYAGDTITAQTKLIIEDDLLVKSMVTKKEVLVAEKPWIIAVAQLTLEGPALAELPLLVSKDESCAFAVYLTQGKWTVDVKLPALAWQIIPALCEAEISVSSAAGQKVVQTLSVPVRYAALDFKEFMLSDATKPDNVIATLAYRLSSNVKITGLAVARHQLAELAPTSCQFSIREKEGLIEILADITAAPESPFCAGFFSYFLDVAGKKQSQREQVTIAPFRPFQTVCEDQSNASVQQTVKAISEALSIRQDCRLMDSLLRKKNADSVFRKSDFALSLASSKISNLEPLARLTGLRELVLIDNPELIDLRPLTYLKSLMRLDLEYTNVADFSPLYRLDAMKLFYSDVEKIDCKKSEVTNKPLQNLCTQE